MSFEGGFSRTATSSGNFTTIKLPCELRPLSQDESVVYRLSFEPGWWGRECTMLLVMPSDVRVVPEEAKRNAKADDNTKLTRTEL
ncbi:hypothetical protein AAVH_38299 [Aphelenchoides avenae]|nr:hypothetical protein AAVH_38299 [Aphelenchus avenae]